MNTRMEHDTMGEIAVPAEHHWGAQTQRSLENFKIGGQRQPQEIITAFAYLKEACAQANADCGKLTAEQAGAIAAVCAEIRAGRWNDEFPLVVWQTGSGTQTNMNVNEVIAHLAADRGMRLHPNDHVNASQSSNDTFPSALHIAAALSVTEQVLPAAERLAGAFRRLEEAYPDLIRIGRTHLQDATPLKFAQEVSGWRELVEAPCRMLRTALPELTKLAIGGTAVGTGLNAPKGYDEMVCGRLRAMTGVDFTPDANKFHALTSKDALVFAHGALKALAANLIAQAAFGAGRLGTCLLVAVASFFLTLLVLAVLFPSNYRLGVNAGVAVMILFLAVTRWNDYFNALIYTTKNDYLPLQMVLRSILLNSQTAMQKIDTSAMDTEAIKNAARLAYMAEAMKYALIVVSSAPLLIVYPFVQKYFVAGMMVGAVKG